MIFRLGMVVFIATVLTGCTAETDSGDDAPSPYGRISLQSGEGLFVSADNKTGEWLVADRPKSGREELFNASHRPDSMLLLHTPGGVPVIPDPETGLLRPARNQEDASVGATYHMEEKPGARIVLRHPRAGYVVVNPQKNLEVGAEYRWAEPFKIVSVPYLDFRSLPASEKLPFGAGLGLLAAGLLAFHSGNRKYAALAALFAGAFLLRYFVSMLPPGLHVWDEQYHALVAKNMTGDPFKPMLIVEALYNYPITEWTMGHVWLHKQPLFLWQIAASFKVFGVSTFALRLPSMLMSAAVCLFIYRIGSRLISRRAGYFGGFFFACCYYFLELGAGAIHTDHNDVAFLFYVSGAVAAWIEYEKSFGRRRLIFLALIGLSAGAAVLIKWLPGILVFSGWGISILADSERRNNVRLYIEAGSAAALAVAVFLPWQLYVLRKFPEVSRYEFGLNSSHFFEALEGHGGNWMFHLDAMKELYGLPFYLVIPCIVVLIFRIRERIFRIAVSVFIAVVYAFFTVAATKMVGFTGMVAFLIFLSFGAVVDLVFELIRNYLRPFSIAKVWPALAAITVFGIGYIGLQVDELEKMHLAWQEDEYSYFSVRDHNIRLLQHVDPLLPDDRPVAFFNCFDYDNIAVLFFTKAATAYCHIPEKAMIESLRKKGMHIVVSDNGKLPDYILDDPEIQVLKGFKYW